MAPDHSDSDDAWLLDGGVMGVLVREHDWSVTPLGSIGTWSFSLRSTVGTMLASAVPTILAWGPELNCIYNDAYRPLLGAKPEALGRPFAEVWPDMRGSLLPATDKARAGQASRIKAMSVTLTHNGLREDARFDFCFSPVLDETGAVMGIVKAAIETTEKPRNDQSLRERERRLSVIFSAAPVGLAEISRAGRFLRVNDELCRILGRPSEEVRRLTVADVSHPDDIAPSLAVIAQVLRTGRSASLDKRYRRPDGTLVWANSSITPLKGQGEEEAGFLVATFDLTAQREAEAALRESEARFRTLTQTMPQLVWTAVGEGHWTWASDRWTAFTGQAPDEWLGWGWLGPVHPDDQDRARQAWREAIGAGEFDAELRLRRRDGAWRWFQVRALPVPGADRRKRDWCGAFTDVTDLKEAEAMLRRARDEAEAASREKSRFLASVSHDLRQPVQAATLFLGVLSQKPLGHAERTLVNSLSDSLTSLTGMLTGLLEVARLDAGLLKPDIQIFEFDDLLQRLHGEFQGIAREAGLRLYMPPAAFPVLSDPLLVELLLRNLISNAIKFTEVGDVSVEARAEGGVLAIDVADTGRGIAPEDVGRIFEEYYQVGNAAREHARGFGIGLATVRRVAALIGTDVAVRSAPGHGSTFSLRLPLAGRPAPSPSGEAGESTLALAGRTALVVDDEPMVLKAMEVTLKAWGVQVHPARTLKQAQAILDELPQPPDLLIADYSLAPGEYGTDAIAAARRRGTRVTVLITGDTARDRLVEAKSNSTLMLHKPVNPEQLEALLTEAFTTRPAR